MAEVTRQDKSYMFVLQVLNWFKRSNRDPDIARFEFTKEFALFAY